MLNSDEIEELQKLSIKLHNVVRHQLDSYILYLNNLIDKKQKLNSLYHQSMIDFLTSVKEENIDEKYNAYCVYILDRINELPIHKQYIRSLKLKKINELNDNQSTIT